MSVVLATGSYFFYKAHLISYKNDYRLYTSSNSSNITKKVITINKNDLYKNFANLIWEDNNKELVFNKHLYDVLEVKLITNEIEITLVSDEEEQHLKNQFEDSYRDDLAKKKDSPAKMLKQFLDLKCLVFFNQSKTNTCFFNINKTNTAYYFKVTKVYLAQETPPPIFS